MPPSDPDISRPRLIRDGSFLEADWNEIAQRRGAHNRLGFAYQIAFARILGRFPRQVPLEIDGEIPRFTALQLRLSPEMIYAYGERRQTDRFRTSAAHSRLPGPAFLRYRGRVRP